MNLSEATEMYQSYLEGARRAWEEGDISTAESLDEEAKQAYAVMETLYLEQLASGVRVVVFP